MTIRAFLKGMVPGKRVPVLALVGRENPGALTQGTGPIEGGQNGRPDEFRPIRDPPHCLAERLVRLERHDFLLFVLFVHGKSSFRLLILCIT